MLRHERVQYPAGQGFFHVGRVSSGAADVDYLYDCGTTAGSNAMRKSVGHAAHAGLLARPDLDVAFLSHLHRDHINGLPRLRARGMMPMTVVLPYLDDVARLITFASDAAHAGSDDDGGFVQEMIIGGAAALRDLLGVERVYEVHSSDGPPTGEPVDAVGPDAPEGDGPEGDRLRVEPFDPSGVRSTGAGVWAIGHGNPFVVRRTRPGRSDSSAVWLLKVHVDEGIPGARSAFIDRLDDWRRREGTHDGSPVEEWLRAEHVRRTLVQHHVDVLIDAFGGRDRLNATSLSLYSGPTNRMPPYAHEGVLTRAGRSLIPASVDLTGRTSWLGTGDACLASEANLDGFLSHYRDEIDTVATLTAPHHGSRENSDGALYARVRPAHVVVAASPRGGYQHPHVEAMHDAAASGARIVLVGEEDRSQFSEEVVLRDA